MEGQRYITIYVDKALLEFLDAYNCHYLLLKAVEHGLTFDDKVSGKFYYDDFEPVNVLVNEKLAKVWEEASQGVKDFILFVINVTLLSLIREYAISLRLKGGEA